MKTALSFVFSLIFVTGAARADFSNSCSVFSMNQKWIGQFLTEGRTGEILVQSDKQYATYDTARKSSKIDVKNYSSSFDSSLSQTVAGAYSTRRFLLQVNRQLNTQVPESDAYLVWKINKTPEKCLPKDLSRDCYQATLGLQIRGTLTFTVATPNGSMAVPKINPKISLLELWLEGKNCDQFLGASDNVLSDTLIQGKKVYSKENFRTYLANSLLYLATGAGIIKIPPLR